MYVTAAIRGHRIIFVWSWKKLIWKQVYNSKYYYYLKAELQSKIRLKKKIILSSQYDI